MPTAYGYAHEFHLRGQQSLSVQSERIKDYYGTLRDRCAWGGVRSDTIQAARVPFFRRPAGKWLVEVVQPGDHVIFTQLECVLISLKEFVYFLEYFQNQEVTVHIVDFNGHSVETGTPKGDLMLKVLAEMVELKRTTRSQRIKEGKQQKLANHEWAHGGKPMFGCKVHVENGKKRLRYDPEQRKIMGQIVDMHDKQGCSFEHIASILKDRIDRRNHIAVSRLYFREKLIRDLKITDPMLLPHGEDLRKLTNRFREEYQIQRLKRRGYRADTAEAMVKKRRERRPPQPKRWLDLISQIVDGESPPSTRHNN